jgi:hypothetical protein
VTVRREERYAGSSRRHRLPALLLPSLVTRAMSLLEFADRGRGMGLWTAAFFLGEFPCPPVLPAGKEPAGGLASAVALLGVATAVLAAALLTAARRPVLAASPDGARP